MPRWLDRLLDLGPSDEPRAVSVGSTTRRVSHNLTPTPGARMRIGVTGSAEEQRALLWCVRIGIPFEREGAGVWCDGEPWHR